MNVKFLNSIIIFYFCLKYILKIIPNRKPYYVSMTLQYNAILVMLKYFKNIYKILRISIFIKVIDKKQYNNNVYLPIKIMNQYFF